MYYKNGQIEARPKIRVSNPTDSDYKKGGWIPYERDVPEFDADTQKVEPSEVIEENGKAVQKYNLVELTELEKLQRQIISDLEIRIKKLERKLKSFADTNDTEDLKDSDIPYENGITVKAGQIVLEGGKRYEVLQPEFTTQESWKPSILYEEKGNRTLWKKIQDTDNPCADAPAWNSNNFNDYSVGYQVKDSNSIWEATNTTHTWIKPAKTGDGSISWKHIKDC